MSDLTWHTCNAYCRDGCHAAVAFTEDGASEAETLEAVSAILARYGLRPLAVRPAPEARPQPEKPLRTWRVLDGAAYRIGAPTRPHGHGWLVAFEEARP